MRAPSACARSRAVADLPLAVGPAIRIARIRCRAPVIAVMDTVLVLIARPGSGAIDDAVLTAVRRIVPGEPRWLAQREAVELPLTGSSASAARPREGGAPVSSRSDGFPLARE